MPPDVPEREIKKMVPGAHISPVTRILYRVCVLFWCSPMKIDKHQPQLLIPGSFL
jgi:hypothetical protein